MTALPSDRDLVAAVIRSGDEHAFRDLYRRHTPRLYRIAVRIGADREQLAEDAVHDVWIRAVERFAAFEWRSTLATWLTGILVNRVRELRRDRRRQATEPLDEWTVPDETSPFPDDRLDLEEAIAALSPGYRAVVVLHDIEGFTHDEIASLLSIDPGTSKSQLSRARARLRHWLDPSGRRAT